MKHFILSMAAAIVFSAPAFSQNFQLGLKGGANISNFRGNDYQDVKSNTIVGFHAGAFVNVKFGPVFSINRTDGIITGEPGKCNAKKILRPPTPHFRLSKTAKWWRFVYKQVFSSD